MNKITVGSSATNLDSFRVGLYPRRYLVLHRAIWMAFKPGVEPHNYARGKWQKN
jgi:hypothetical protein